MSLQKAKALFVDLVASVPPERWDARLAELASGDDELHRQVSQILAAHRSAGSFLDAPAVALVEALEAPAEERLGAVIGSYKLLEQIGEGGFGVVYMAEQTAPVKRTVALKVIKPGMDSRQVVARFEAERQALAIMDHPNIAKVFDGGLTPLGRPYFVMELVKGAPITDFCDRQRLSPRQRIELLLSVCQAVQHAHQKGVIHRDLKPSNILVTVHDTIPVPKVIDFGVAKAVGQTLTDKSLFTGFAQMIGTPLYMSPEQAGQSGLDIDTRSDIYSLGVLLYELLTGSTPFSKERFKTAAYDEIRRIIHEEDPPNPSTRLTESKETLPSISAQRQMEPEKLARLVRGELDWIVMKALEKDRSRRYSTASSLADDLQRFLFDEPVQACPPSTWYRFRKFARRHKGGMALSASATMVVLVALVGLIVSNRLISNETREKQAALFDREAALDRAHLSEQDARDQLFQAMLNRARAERVSGRVGQRFETLKVLRQAARVRITPELAAEAAAALVLPDFEIDRQWEAFPPDSVALAFDADCRNYARLDNQGGVTLCRYVDGREEIVTKLPPHGRHVFLGLAMSPDGKFIAAGHSGDLGAHLGEMRVWNYDGTEPAVVLDESNVIFPTVTFHADGQRLAFATTDGNVRVIDLMTGKPIAAWSPGGTVESLAFHPRDHRIAVGAGGVVRLCDSLTGQQLVLMQHGAAVSEVSSIAWRPDGELLATGCDDRKIHVWNPATAAEVMPPWHHGDLGLRVVFDRTGDRVLSIGWDRRPHLWDAATGRLMLKGTGIFTLHVGSDNRWFGFDTVGNQVRLWRMAAGKELRVFQPRDSGSRDVFLFPIADGDDRFLAAGDAGRLCIFDVESGLEAASLNMPGKRTVWPFAFDDSGAWLTAGECGLLKWPTHVDAARNGFVTVGPPRRVAKGFESNVGRGSAASPDGRIIVMPSQISAAIIDQGAPERRIDLGGLSDVRYCAATPEWIVTCNYWPDGTSPGAQIWSAKTGAHLRDLPLQGYADARFSPDGRWLATRSYEWGDVGEVRVWDTQEWRQRLRFKDGACCFSADSRLIAHCDLVGSIRLTELSTGREVGRLGGLEPKVIALSHFSRDGSRLIGGSYQREIYVWDLRAIRAQLKAEGLDWEWPELPPRPHAPAPRRVEIVAGDLGDSMPSPHELALRDIEMYRQRVAADPKSPLACNGLAWAYVMAPESLRDPPRAVELAETAARAEPANAIFANTLGAAYFRAGRFQDAVAALQPNLVRQDDAGLVYDLYFLSMACHRLGQAERAKDFFDWATRWTRVHPNETPEEQRELELLKAEALALLETQAM